MSLDWRRAGLEVGATLCFGLAMASIAVLTFFRWFAYGDPERYAWLISGPGVLGQLGGGPFQLWLGAGFLFLAVSGVSAGAAFRGRLAVGGWRGWPAAAASGAILAVVPGIWGLLLLA